MWTGLDRTEQVCIGLVWAVLGGGGGVHISITVFHFQYLPICLPGDIFYLQKL